MKSGGREWLRDSEMLIYLITAVFITTNNVLNSRWYGNILGTASMLKNFLEVGACLYNSPRHQEQNNLGVWLNLNIAIFRYLYPAFPEQAEVAPTRWLRLACLRISRNVLTYQTQQSRLLTGNNGWLGFRQS